MFETKQIKNSSSFYSHKLNNSARSNSASRQVRVDFFLDNLILHLFNPTQNKSASSKTARANRLEKVRHRARILDSTRRASWLSRDPEERTKSLRRVELNRQRGEFAWPSFSCVKDAFKDAQSIPSARLRRTIRRLLL